MYIIERGYDYEAVLEAAEHSHKQVFKAFDFDMEVFNSLINFDSKYGTLYLDVLEKGQ